ncbi:23S rRNA (adenine(2503)-C(2))-methyltransferase RlmN [Stomatohabitans albus]|uniref:23S rRNA (adenine(2503)-C(2))-methyltransferase RlmN n=1 Tax=Stomatohabitans albus TaxID=3110766 RepID=UPI00300D85E1
MVVSLSRPVRDLYNDDELAHVLEDQPAFRVNQVQDWLAKGIDDPAKMHNLPRALREQLAEAGGERPRIIRVSEADDGLTRKVLLQCGNEAIESVLMLYPKTNDRAGRATVCISTQAGCAMGCPFCATGQIGLKRQLTLGETVRQVTVMQRLLAGDADPEVWGEHLPAPLPKGVPDHVTNVVFMGMGEPFANQKVCLGAVKWLHERFGLGARSITVSTVGIVPGIKRLQAMDLPVTLAVSLHAPTDALRNDLVPANKAFSIDELLSTVADYLAATKRRVTIEYVMIDQVNSATYQAKQLRDVLKKHLGLGKVHVNLIPMNPTPAVPWFAPPIEQQQAFAQVLNDGGIPATIRANRGNDIDAACGQLYANYQAGSGKTLPRAVGAADRVMQHQMTTKRGSNA